MTNVQDEFLSIEETADKLKVSKVTLYRMARKGKIPAVKFGKVWRVSSKLLSELFTKKAKNDSRS